MSDTFWLDMAKTQERNARVARWYSWWCAVAGVFCLVGTLVNAVAGRVWLAVLWLGLVALNVAMFRVARHDMRRWMAFATESRRRHQLHA